MRRIHVYLIVSFLVAAGAGTAGARVTLVEERNGKMVVDVLFDPSPAVRSGSLSVLGIPGLPALTYERFFVAIPAGAVVRVMAGGGDSADRRGDLPPVVAAKDPPEFVPLVTPVPGFYPAAPVVATEPFLFRKTRVIAVDCFSSQVDMAAGVERKWSGYAVEISYTPGEAFTGRSGADPLVARMVINEKIFPAPRAVSGGPAGEGSLDRGPAAGAADRGAVLSRGSAAGISDPHFSLSPNWIKITVDSAGVYSIDGNDLARVGVNLAAIDDPSSFRLFSRGGVELERRDGSGEQFADPDGTWRPGQWMTECDVAVEYGGDGTFDPADRVLFYGVGAYGWMDLYQPGASRHEYHDHPYAKENAYFLTWDDDPGFSGAPGRMASVTAAPLVSEPDITEFEERIYFERNQLEALSYGGDGWLWLEVTPKSGSETVTFPAFPVYDLVTSRAQRFRTLALAPIKSGKVNWNHHAVYIMNGAPIGDMVFQSYARYDSARVFDNTGSFLQEGQNVFRLSIPRDLNVEDFMYFDQYAVFYGRRLDARGGRLLFSAPDTTGTVNFRVADFAAGETVYVFEVSGEFSPRALSGLEQTDSGGRRTVRFSYDVGATRPCFWAGSSSAVEKPVRIERYTPRDLRVVSSPPEMLIICHPSFRSAAERLKNHRAAHYSHGDNPTIEVVTTREVFDNFSGGLVDPMGIRNYCKFLFDNATDALGQPALAFLLLLGDANIDFKNYITSQENLVTTNLNLDPYSLDAYATDDWFAELEPRRRYKTHDDPPRYVPGLSYPQIAVGRLPAGTAADATFLVDRVIDYETEADFGPWRDRVILVADDEVTPNRPPEPSFTWDSESIALAYMSPFLEPAKIYLTEYPMIGSWKPTSRLAFLERWNEGALAINYIGHGSSVQMADEQVFLGTDVANLRNGLRLPIFLAFSCTIGDFGRAQGSCLAEKLILWPAGGAIAAITASEVSFIGPNTDLNSKVFGELTPRVQGTPQEVGDALLRAKVSVMAPYDSSESYRLLEENNQKYNLLGDPSMPLASPRRSVSFVPEDVDTFTAGKRATIRGTVMNDGTADTSFHGTVDLVLREPDDGSGYTSSDGLTHIVYRYPGGTIYRGTAEVSAGSFEFSIKIPRSVSTGPLAFARAYADNGSADAVEIKDDCYVAVPSPGDTTGLNPLDGPPRVDLGFKGGQTIVKPGAVLEAKINDADGINILNTTPEGKVALVFDRTNLPLDVTNSFEFDAGGTDTSGVLTYPLPELSVGRHAVVVKVADSFGLVALDTLQFDVTDPMDYTAEVVLNYPNPFAESTYFLVNLTDPADIQLEIFTVSGKKIRTLKQRGGPGEAWILWDGKDTAGAGIGNGTYLYVARVSFVGLDRTPLTRRGKVVKIE